MIFAPWWMLLFLLLGGKRKDRGEPKSAPLPQPTPAPPGRTDTSAPTLDPFFAAWRTRTFALLPRARTGAAWVGRMSKLLKSDAVGAAAARWIGIESGGNPRAGSSLNERGLAQVAKGTLAELGLTEADYAAMASPATTDDEHAKFAAKVISGETNLALKRAPVATDWGPEAIGVGKLRHGLPLLLRELAEQRVMRPTIAATIDAARAGSFKPSARLASFGGGKHKVTGKPVDDLIIRFLGSAAVVAHGDDAPRLFRAPDGGAPRGNV